MASQPAQDVVHGIPARGPGRQPAGHQPYVPDSAQLPEFTWSAVVVGTLLGIVFGASSLYLVLKVGMTVSASIPVAVMSITLFRLFSRLTGMRPATILENNIVQTTGSAGESIAFGVGVTMPALMLLGFEMEPMRVMMVSVLGGILGILMMIPLRRAFIVQQHGILKYPEGTACADVLVVGEQGGSTAQTVFAGFGLAFVYQLLWKGLRLWKETVSQSMSWLPGATASMDADPTLLGVGYIIGTRVSSIMLAGALLSYFVFAPAIHFFGESLTTVVKPGTMLIRDMDADAIRKFYILYIGAGAVAAGGIISLCRALPLIVSSVVVGVRDLAASMRGAGSVTRRTDRDLPLSWVVIGSLALILAIWVLLPAGSPLSFVSLMGAVLVVAFGFLFVTVSSRLTGEIGSSSNPISGMTIATLLLTCLIFLACHWTTPGDRLIAISVAAVVCVASSNGGTTSQDLKTGFLVGATPKYQQWAIVIGAVSSALVIGWILLALNASGTVYTRQAQYLPTPKTPPTVANLHEMQTVPGDPSGQAFHVWRVGEAEAATQGIPVGKYLVDDDAKIRWLVDPGINGRVKHRDNGMEVRKYSPPQAKLFALITDGILTQELPWTLVLLGAFVAVVLELSGVPSLPFAVGVYLPFSVSAPVFVGGMVRYAADRYQAWHTGHVATEAESETSPGVLFSTGYIAGGAIGGVLIAFTLFSDPLNEALGRWQYREYHLPKAMAVAEAYRDAAKDAIGSNARDDALRDTAVEIESMNEGVLKPLIEVPAGTEMKVPGEKTLKTVRIEPAATLAEVAKQQLGNASAAGTLYELNSDRLKLPAQLPAGTALKLPQPNWPAMLAFGVLVLLLVCVGLGWMLQSAPAAPGEAGEREASAS